MFFRLHQSHAAAQPHIYREHLCIIQLHLQAGLKKQPETVCETPSLPPYTLPLIPARLRTPPRAWTSRASLCACARASWDGGRFAAAEGRAGRCSPTEPLVSRRRCWEDGALRMRAPPPGDGKRMERSKRGGKTAMGFLATGGPSVYFLGESVAGTFLTGIMMLFV